MITLKNKENNKYLDLDGSKNYNHTFRAKKMFGKTRHCKTVKIAQAFAAEVAILTAIRCGYHILISEGEEIELPPSPEKGLEIIKELKNNF